MDKEMTAIASFKTDWQNRTKLAEYVEIYDTMQHEL
jgi:hypothetical protein